MVIVFNKIINSFYLLRSEWADFFSDLFSYFHIKMYFLAIFIINGLSWFLSYRIFKSFSVDDQITLHYNVDFGINLIGSPKEIFSLPIMGLVIMFINTISLKFVTKYTQEKRFNRNLFLLPVIIMNIFLLVAIMTLNFVNIDQ